MTGSLLPNSRPTIVRRSPRSQLGAVSDPFAERAESLVLRGFKPKDTADITLQEIMPEHRNDQTIMGKARAEAEEFLRRVRDGVI
jgi:hypothetical protein